MRLGEMLLERQFVSAEDLDRALELQKERGEKIGKILVDGGLLCRARRDGHTVGSIASAVDHDRRPACDLARNRKAVRPIPPPVSLPAGRSAGFQRHAGDGGSARFRDTRGGAHLHRFARRTRACDRAGDHRRR